MKRLLLLLAFIICLSIPASAQTVLSQYLVGNGSPEGVITAPPGRIYIRLDAATKNFLYIKETSTGNTGWVQYTDLGGDVTAASAFSNDNRLIRSDGTGKGVQASGITIDDSNNASGLGTLNTHTIPGGTSTFAITSNNLSVFASTTSAQLAGVLSDESGTGGGFLRATDPTITGGSHTALTGLGIRSTGTGAFDLTLANSENLTAGRTLTIALNDAARTLTISGNATVTGTNTGDQTITLTSDVTGSGTGSFATTIANNVVTFAKMADITTDRLIGRDTAATGDPEEITVGGGLEFTGSGGIQRSALTGDVTASAGSGSTTIAAQLSSFWAGKITDETGTDKVAFSDSPVFTTQITSPKVVWTGTVQDLAGAGTPEGSVTAPVGSVYRRTDGGASTTVYAKESGTGNTGWVAYGPPGGSGAPAGATYITQTADGTLTNEQALSSLSSGIMRVATTTGVITSLTDSAGIADNIGDETGSGALMFGTSPTFTTSLLGGTDAFIRFDEHSSAPGTPAAGNVVLYAKADGLLYSKDDAGVETVVTGGGGGGGSPGGSDGNLQYRVNSSTFGGVAGSSVDTLGAVTLSPTARSSGSPFTLKVVGPADTTLTADTEAIGIDFDVDATRQFTAGGGAFNLQREVLFRAPTYSADAAETITRAATLAITGAPIAGTNMTISEPLALFVQGGNIRLSSPLITLDTVDGNGETNIHFYDGTNPVTRILARGTSGYYGLAALQNGGIDFRIYDDQSNVLFRVGNRLTSGDAQIAVPLGIGASGPTGTQLHVRSGDAARVGLIVSTAASPTADIAQFEINGTDRTLIDKDGKVKGAIGSGSNSAGTDVVLAGGESTGNALGGLVRLQVSNVGASGSTLNTLIDRIVVGPRTALTDATNVNLFEIALPTLKGASGVIEYTIYAADATDVQVRSGVARFSAVNKGGTYTTEIVILNEAASLSAGTLSATLNFLNGTDKVTLRVNADTSLTATSFYITYAIKNNSEQAITIL